MKTDPHYYIKEKHGGVIIHRLNRLLQVGYRVDMRLSNDFEIPLVHPGKDVPKVCIWSDGKVVDLHPESEKREADRTIINAEDTRAFDTFLARIPEPTFLQKVARTSFREAWEWMLALGLLAVVFIVVGWGSARAWDWLKNLFGAC